MFVLGRCKTTSSLRSSGN